MNKSWSSKQRLSLEDQNSLARDLLGLLIRLQNNHYNTLDTTRISNSMILDIITTNTLINQGKEQLVILGRNYGRRRRSFGPRPIINSIKNSKTFGVGVTGTKQTILVAKAVDTPVTSSDSDVQRGCTIKAIYCIFDGCGLGGAGVLNQMLFYAYKNAGANLTAPDPNAVGTSNEKRFVFKQWNFMIMRNQDGNTPFHWEGWLPIPRKYQRMATDDRIDIVVQCTTALTGNFTGQFIYKWYT